MKIWMPYDFDNWNDYINKERTNKYIANNLKQKEKKIVAKYAKEQYKGKYPIQITFRTHFNAHRKDLDNTRVKGIIDGLVACKTLKNDNLNCIQKIVLEPVFDDVIGVEIEIQEMSAK